MRGIYQKKVTVNDLLAFANKMKKTTGEDNPEVTFEDLNNGLFPSFWKELEDRIFIYHTSHSEDDPDCYCE